MSPRPGLTKVRRVPHVSRTTKSFVRTLESAVKAWLDLADMVSEGAVARDAKGVATYFGSSSILLEWDRAPDDKLRDASVLAALESDPHLRVRALRLARREAEVRANGELHTMRADFTTKSTRRGLILTIDVEARVVATVKTSRRSS